MQSCEFKIGGLELRILGRERPGSDSPDGDWYIVAAACHAEGSSVEIEGPFLRAAEIASFHESVLQLYNSLSGEALLTAVEGNLTIAVQALGSLGHFSTKICITPDVNSQKHEFHFEVDQSDLKPVISALANISRVSSAG